MREQKPYDLLEHMGWVFLKIALGLVVLFPAIWLLGILVQPLAMWVIQNVPLQLQPLAFVAPMLVLFGIGFLIAAAIRRRAKKGPAQ